MISPDALAACMLALRMSAEHCKQAYADLRKRAHDYLEAGEISLAHEVYSRAVAHVDLRDDFLSALSEIQEYIKRGGV